jgi:hypothetical protein
VKAGPLPRGRYAYTCLYQIGDDLFWGDGTIMSRLAVNVTETHRAEAAAWGLVRAGDGKPGPPCVGPGLEGL